jgi:hypothetical protein
MQLAANVKYKSNMESIAAAIFTAANDAATRAAVVLAGEMKQTLSSGQGRVVNVDGKNEYIGSPPGMPPGIRTGNLRRSVTHTPASSGVAKAGSNSAYAKALEYGWQGKAYGGGPSIYVPARPWAWRSYLSAQTNMQAVAASVFKERFSG